MSFVSKIEAVFTAGSMKRNRTINEKNRVIYIVFFAELRGKLTCDYVRSCGFKLCMSTPIESGSMASYSQ